MTEQLLDFNSSFRTLNPEHNAACMTHWLLHPGMLFNSRQKWWSDSELRGTCHEGLDLCCFQGQDYALHTVTPDLNFPAIFSGKVRKIISDLLSKTIIIEHFHSQAGPDLQLCSIYAHVQPLPGIAATQTVTQGQALCTVPPVSKNIPGLIAHLHISLAWIPAHVLPQLNWTMLNQRQNLQLENPLQWLTCNYQVVTWLHLS